MRYALVPVKELTQAKERLSPLLSPDERHALAVAMLNDVLSALAQVPAIDRIALVTRDPGARSMAAQRGLETVDEGSVVGLTEAVEMAVQVCIERGASSLAVIPGDIPLLKPADVDSVIEEGASHDVVIVPSWDSRGTNTILLRPPDVLPMRFSSWSFFKARKICSESLSTHVAHVKKRGASVLDSTRSSCLAHTYEHQLDSK